MAQKQAVQNRDRNIIEPGSERHMLMLGIRKAEPEDEITYEGYALIDMTSIPAAQPYYWKQVLRQAVAVLQAGAPPTPQSRDPWAANYAPPMIDPDTGQNDIDPAYPE